MTNDDIDKTKHLIFELGGLLYASPLHVIERVLEYSEPRAVPNSVKCFKGVINFRGDVIGILDLRELFSFKKPTSNPSFIVYNLEESKFAASVDTIKGISSIGEEQIKRELPSKSAVPQKYITGLSEWKNQLLLIVDLKKILTDEELFKTKTILSENAA